MEWDAGLPIKYLPEVIADTFREEAQRLYSDLLENRLTVVLRPAYQERFEGQMVRAVESKNPEWYRELYHATPHLKRQRTLRSLDRIAQTCDLPYRNQRGAVSPYGSYDTRYRELIGERLSKGYDLNGIFIPSDPLVKEFFSGKENKDLLLEEIVPF